MMTLPISISGIHKVVYEASPPDDKQYMDKMNKSDATQINASLVQSLYKSVLDRNKIDFGDIPDSKGDITKVKYIQSSEECLAILEDIQARNRNIQIPEIIDVRKCIANIKTLTRSFTQGFAVKHEIIMTMYNTMVLACVDATSCLISSHMDIITGGSTQPKLNTKSDKSRGIVSIDNIKNFNEAFNKGQIFNTLTYLLDENKKHFAGTEVVVTGVIIMGVLSIVPITRELVFFYYNSRVGISDYLQIQSDLLEMNRLAIESSKRPEKEKKTIIKKQESVIKNMRKMSDKIAINNVDTNDVAKKEIKDENNLFSLSNIESQISNNKLSGNTVRFI